MGIRTLGRFLVGRADAILAVAYSRWSVPLGALFVLAAAMAREYDGASLRDEPWHLLIPFGASLVAATLLYGLLFLTSWLRKQRPHSFWRGWYRFLGLFWMTAPMALLYGIPYERFLPELAAVKANLATLALVAAWRVALMTRIVNVVWAWGPVVSGIVTLAFADAVAIAALSQARFPVLNVMGGIRYSESEALMAEVGLAVTVIAWLTMLPLVIFYVAVTTSRWLHSPVLNDRSMTVGVARPLVLLGVATCLVWVPGMYFWQGEQRLRYRVEQLMLKGEVASACRLMSQQGPQEFPPHWSPPPRVELGDDRVPQDRVLVALASMDPPSADWVERAMTRKVTLVYHPFPLVRLSPAEFDIYVAWLMRIPEGPEIAARHLMMSGTAEGSAAEQEWFRSALERLKRLIVERGEDLKELRSNLR